MPLSDLYFLNNPIFLKYKRRFDWRRLRRLPELTRVIINERIIEIPFAIRALGAIPAGGRVLDLGCMESMLPLFLSGMGYQVTGFDFREYPYRVPNFTFVQGDICRLPFDEGSFDAVTCVSTIEHVGIGFYNDPTGSGGSPDLKGMAEARRVLKSGGLLVLSVPFGQAVVNHQQRVYDADGVRQLLAGFTVLTTEYYKNTAGSSGHNYWEKIPLAAAAALSYQTGTECVCCAVAKK